MKASNAVISGTVFATNGYFKGTVHANNGFFKGSVSATNGFFTGTVDASDINLNGKSLKFTSDSGNTLEIFADDISVSYVPKTYRMPASTNSLGVGTYTGNGGYRKQSSISVTGETNITFPTAEVTGNNLSVSTGANWSAYTFVFSADNSSDYTIITDLAYPDDDHFIGYARTTGRTPTSNIRFSFPQLTRSLNGGPAGRYFYWGYWLKISGANGQTGATASFPEITLTVSPDYTANDGSDKFIKIGQNGIQIFLGNGFYFTCARDESGPVIALGGKVNGTMKSITLNTNGLYINGATQS